MAFGTGVDPRAFGGAPAAPMQPPPGGMGNAFMPDALQSGPRYAPVNAKGFASYPNIKLAPGTHLAWQKGKGYYAKPGAPPSTPTQPPGKGGGPEAPSVFTPGVDPTTGATYAPVMSAKDIANDASTTARGEINSMTAPVTQSAAAQDAAFKASALQAAGFNKAADKVLASIAPQIQGAYNGAATETGQLANGFTSSLQGTLGQEQADSAAWAAAHGAGPGSLPQGVDPSAFGNALYMQNGFIPASLLAQQGAHAAQYAAGNRVVNQDVGHATEQGIAANQAAADAKSAQQIANIAAKYPELFTKQEHEDIAANAKATATNASIHEHAATIAEQKDALAEKATRDYNTAQHQLAQDNMALRKQGFTERQAKQKLTLSYDQLNAKISYQNGELKIRGTSAQASWLRAQTAAHGINAGASKVAGHLMMNNGQPLLTKDGKYIATDPKVYSSGRGKGTTSITHPNGVFGDMVKQARTDLKTFNSSAIKIPSGTSAPGIYRLAPQYLNQIDPSTDFAGGGSGILAFPASTNDPARAAHGSDLTLADEAKAYAAQYGVPVKQARRALIAGGWKATGRPKTKGLPKWYTDTAVGGGGNG